MVQSQSVRRIAGTARWAILFMAVNLLGACAMYNRPYDDNPAPDRPYQLRVVQSDDYGSLWDPEAAETTLSTIREQSKTSNVFIVLFIHGWNHDAAPGDENLVKSIGALDELHALLDAPSRRRLRECETGSADFKLFGIYVGWRGRTLPGFLNYATFWGRKAAAERVGDGDVAELIQRLQEIYVDATKRPGPKAHITGLVSIGHSFGAQVLWKSLDNSMETPLIAATRSMTDRLKPSTRSRSTTEVTPINSLGDLTILLNPALEAYQFARVDTLYRELRYASNQTPQVVVFSAVNDDARKIWFPLARGVGAPFRPKFRTDGGRGYQGELYGHALGEIDSQRTHELVEVENTPDSLSGPGFLADPRALREFDFSDTTTFSHVQLRRRGDAGDIPFNSPVIVANAEQTIIDGHNGIFEPKFRTFLVNYIAYIEAKRLILKQQDALKQNQSTTQAIAACS